MSTAPVATRAPRPWALGVDIGGTFTDLALSGPDGAMHTTKVRTTPHDPIAAILDGVTTVLAAAGVAPDQVDRVVHGTTLATNLILEGRGARVALVTTAGFGDLLQARDTLTDPSIPMVAATQPEPLVPRWMTVEAPERMTATGEVLVPLDADAAAAVVRDVAALDPEAVAVCLLHSYANATHEERLADAWRAQHPDVPVYVSSEISPAMREYGRAVTTAVSAVVGPAMAAYLSRLDDALRAIGLDCPVHVMESSGGVMPTASAGRRAAHTVESGPAAGVVATQALGRTLGVPDLLSFDMGGTTAKCGVVRDGTAERQPEFYVGGGASGPDRRIGRYVIRMPAIGLAEVGSGGGSIAWLDRAGALRVGPRSAGADPGPACYGLGGTRPTVTDANLLLGYLDADRFAGGTMRLSVDAAADAVEREIAGPLGITVTEAAAAIHGFVTASMAAAVRMTTIQRGLDPRDFTLVAFGGSGPVHAVGLAATFDITRVIVPRQAGVRSAVGLLDTDLSTDQIQGCLLSLVDGDPAVVDATFAALEARARAELSAGADAPDVCMVRSADVRYHGQAHHLVVPVDPGPVDARAVGEIVARFEADYARTYGVRITGTPELVHCRVRAERTVHRADDAAVAAESRRPAAPAGRREAWFDATGTIEVPTYDWRALTNGVDVRGPAVIDGPDSSVVIPPDAVCVCDPSGNLVVDLVSG